MVLKSVLFEKYEGLEVRQEQLVRLEIYVFCFSLNLRISRVSRFSS